MWRVDEGSWACLHETSHGFSVVTSLLYTGSMLYVAGVPADSSSWAETWRDGYFVGGGGAAGAQAANATRYTIARMSQSPTRFHGKYETWGEAARDDEAKAVEVRTGMLLGDEGGRGGGSWPGWRQSDMYIWFWFGVNIADPSLVPRKPEAVSAQLSFPQTAQTNHTVYIGVFARPTCRSPPPIFSATDHPYGVLSPGTSGFYEKKRRCPLVFNIAPG